MESEKVKLIDRAHIVFILCLCLFFSGLVMTVRERKECAIYVCRGRSGTDGDIGLASFAEKCREKMRVDINTSDMEELCALPGVGPATAEKIISFRRKKRGKITPEDLTDIKGIGEVRLERMRTYIKGG